MDLNAFNNRYTRSFAGTDVRLYGAVFVLKRLGQTQAAKIFTRTELLAYGYKKNAPHEGALQGSLRGLAVIGQSLDGF